jgi:hypothetical protein
MYNAMMNSRLPLIISILSLFIIFLWTDSAFSQTRIHEVKEGETIVSIAIAYQMTANELRALNRLTTERLEIGQKLRVRDLDPVVPESAVPAAVGVRPESGSTMTRIDSLRRAKQIPFNPDEHLWYHIKKDDTVSEVARVHGMSIDMLRTFNGDWIYSMKQGDSLIVKKPVVEEPVIVVEDQQPPVETKEVPPAQASPPANDPPPPVQEENKPPVEVLVLPPVVKEDTLQIATQVDEDQVFMIVDRGRFTGHTVGRNERLSSILERYQMDEADFRALNPGLQQRIPRAGEEVFVYEPPTQVARNPYLAGGMGGDEEGAEVAFVYVDADKGKLTASGELYNPASLTVGHPTIALGSILYVVNPATRRGIYVRVNDRIENKGIMLSAAAARALEVNTAREDKLIVTKE